MATAPDLADLGCKQGHTKEQRLVEAYRDALCNVRKNKYGRS